MYPCSYCEILLIIINSNFISDYYISNKSLYVVKVLLINIMLKFDREYLIVIIPIILMIIGSWVYLNSMYMQPMDMNTMNMGTMTEESMDMDSMAMDKEDMKSMQDSDMSMQNTFNILAMPMNSDWNLNDLIVMALMWIVMMFAMMMPTTFNFLYLFNHMRKNIEYTHNKKN